MSDLPNPFKNKRELLKAIKQNKRFYKASTLAVFKTSKFLTIKRSVAGNTIRAYSGGEYEPSSIFRTWAQDYFFKKNNLKKLLNAKNSTSFKKIHRILERNLNNYWRVSAKQNIEFCYSCKLLDLLLKMLIHFEEISKSQKIQLLKNINVPLDKYTLNGIKCIWNDRIKKTTNNFKKILANAAMSFVGDDYTLYTEIQKCIRDSVESHDSIEYDFAVWNRTNIDDSTFHLIFKK